MADEEKKKGKKKGKKKAKNAEEDLPPEPEEEAIPEKTAAEIAIEEEAAKFREHLADTTFTVMINLERADDKLGMRYLKMTEEKHPLIISYVKKDGPTGRAHVEPGTMLIAVCGVLVHDTESFKTVRKWLIQQGALSFPITVAIASETSTFDVNLDHVHEKLGMNYERRNDARVYISKIVKDSAADRAGLKPLMIIKQIDDKPVYLGEDVAKARQLAIEEGRTKIKMEISTVPAFLDNGDDETGEEDVMKAVVEHEPDAPAASPYRFKDDPLDHRRTTGGRTVRGVLNYSDPTGPLLQSQYTVGDVGEYPGPVEYPPPPFPFGGGVGGPSQAAPIPKQRTAYTSDVDRANQFFTPVGARPYARGGPRTHPFAKAQTTKRAQYPVAQNLKNMYPHRRVDPGYYGVTTQPSFVEVPLYAGMRRNRPNSPLRGVNKIPAAELLPSNRDLGVEGRGSPVGLTPMPDQFSPATAKSLYL